jgi:hypothetical protein
MYWNKNRLQSATDAAALAGATYLGNAIFSSKNSLCTYATDAQNAACTYALTNGVALGEIKSVTLGSAKSITRYYKSDGIRTICQGPRLYEFYYRCHSDRRGRGAGFFFSGSGTDWAGFQDPLFIRAIHNHASERLRFGVLAGTCSTKQQLRQQRGQF